MHQQLSELRASAEVWRAHGEWVAPGALPEQLVVAAVRLLQPDWNECEMTDIDDTWMAHIWRMLYLDMS